MKKKYNKPLLTFESFQLTTSIAAGCTVLADVVGGETYVNGFPVNYTDEANCTDNCYHVPDGAQVVFTSA